MSCRTASESSPPSRRPVSARVRWALMDRGWTKPKTFGVERLKPIETTSARFPCGGDHLKRLVSVGTLNDTTTADIREELAWLFDAEEERLTCCLFKCFLWLLVGDGAQLNHLDRPRTHSLKRKAEVLGDQMPIRVDGR